ncbi:unnamed protein product [Colias eurytheme]|nr:unnamed protein product [Colias eurytheme]
MLGIILCGLLVAVNGVPQFFQGDFFPEWKMDSFWRDFDRKFEEFGDQMDHLYGNIDTTDRIKGDKYEVTMIMSGFNEDEISVNVRQGQLVVEGHSADGSVNVYSSRSLPPYVGETGTWTYDNDVLKIVLPIHNGKKSTPEIETPNVTGKKHEISAKETPSSKAHGRRNSNSQVLIIES